MKSISKFRIADLPIELCNKDFCMATSKGMYGNPEKDFYKARNIGLTSVGTGFHFELTSVKAWIWSKFIFYHHVYHD